MKQIRPCMLIILDGWGISSKKEGNAVFAAKTPFLDKLFTDYPDTSLLCSGDAVGLPAGIMGNSEVGHTNIGAGRVVFQNLLRIDKAIKDNSFYENRRFLELIKKLKKNNRALHLMGLVSDGGVHSQLTHLFALIDLAKKSGLNHVFIHPILDGRDTPPDKGVEYIKKLQDYLDQKQTGTIATLCGRFFAMDRDTRWDRTKDAYDLYTKGSGVFEKEVVSAVYNSYEKKVTDEFLEPTVITGTSNVPVATVKDGDGIIFFNFRADRARQITRAFTDSEFDFFEREVTPELAGFVCMTFYDEKFDLPVAFSPEHLDGILSQVISDNGLCQLKIAETEKYAHVTYFFNGGDETPIPLEERLLVPSPRDISTYDQKPEMSANQVAQKLVSEISKDKYHLIVVNFANLDMVGHTGVFDAAVKACETVDRCVEKVVTRFMEKDGVVLITADHGNAETMIDETGKPFTSHTLNPVPLILIDNKKKVELKTGKLSDIAPTILHIMGIEKNKNMTGDSLIINKGK